MDCGWIRVIRVWIRRWTIILVKIALYGLKSAGAAFQSLLADNLMDMGYRPTKADLDVWLRPATNRTGSNTTRWYCVMSTTYCQYCTTPTQC
jgi:hypothetical protein